MKLLLHHCIQSNFFTADQFNDRLTKYDFPEDKPSIIDARILNNSDRKLRQSASQMRRSAASLYPRASHLVQ